MGCRRKDGYGSGGSMKRPEGSHEASEEVSIC